MSNTPVRRTTIAKPLPARHGGPVRSATGQVLKATPILRSPGTARRSIPGLPGQIDTAHPVLTPVATRTVAGRGNVKKPTPPKPSEHELHLAHVKHQQAVAARSAKGAAKAQGVKSTAKAKTTSLDAHQLHVLHLQHIGVVAGATSSPINPPDQGGTVGGGGSSSGALGAIDSATGGAGSTLFGSVKRLALTVAALLLLLWAWRKGYITKAIKGGTSAVGRLGK